MRILFLAPDPSLDLAQQGGAGTHMRGTIEGLTAAGVEVVPVIGTPPGLVGGSIAQRPAPRARQLAPEALRRVGRDVRVLMHGRRFPSDGAVGFDCVYERSGYLLATGLRLARKAGIPYVLETDGMLVSARREAYGAPLWPFAELVERRKHRAADLLVVMSEAMPERISARYEVPPERIFVKGLGVEEALLDAKPREPPGELRVGFAGSFQPYHGVDILLEAARLVPEAEFVLIGDGPGFAAAGERAGPNVSFRGQCSREETLSGLAECRVLVIPESSPDMYPVKFLEYAALHRPIVCPDHRAYLEFERGPGAEALNLFKPGSADDLAEAIRTSLSGVDEEALDELRRMVGKDHTWEAVGRRLAARLSDLATR